LGARVVTGSPFDSIGEGPAGRTPTRAEQVRTAVEIVAILAAGIWALYTFVYDPKVPVHIVRTRLGGYSLEPTSLDGEYDSEDEYPIKP